MIHDSGLQNKDESVQSNYNSLKKIERIDAHYISHEIQHLLHFEKGFPFTVKELLLRPGKAIREFLFDDRNKYVKPVVFLIFMSVVFTTVVGYFHIDYSFFNIDKIEPLKGKIRSKEIGDWTNNHFGYTNIVIGVFIATWIKFFFRKHDYNIFEIVILMCFALGEAILILGVFVLGAVIFDNAIIVLCGVLLYYLYVVYAISQFFGEKKLINYLKSSLACVLGCMTYIATLTLIAYLLKVL